MSTPADIEERQAALNIQQSIAITAPAGSGKTELLTQRVLALLAQVEQPEEIICITFTRKAASEMHQRIVNSLVRAATEPAPTAAHALTNWTLARAALDRDQQAHWQLLDNPQRLRILTIDGLCRALTLRNPVDSQIGGSTQLLDNPQLIYSEAVQATLNSLEDESGPKHALSLLLLHFDNNLDRVHTLLVSLLSSRSQWLAHVFSANHQDARAYFEAVLEDVIREALENIQQRVSIFWGELYPLASYAAANCRQEAPDSAIVALDEISDLPQAAPQDLSLWLALCQLLMTNDNRWRSPKGLTKAIGFPAGKTKEEKAAAKSQKTRMAEMLTAFADCDGLLESLARIRSLPTVHYSERQWQLLQALTQILPLCYVQLKLAFRRLNAVDFTEISQGALQALGDSENPSNLALMLDYQIKHLLVDEFQDTSVPQLQLLEKLTAGWQPDDGRTLFIVGDGMQSCYSFRDANVGLFLDARRHGIGNLPLRPLDLCVNFRSQRNIVDWVNRAFETAFPPQDDIARGAVKYAPSVAFNDPLPGTAVNAHVIVDDSGERNVARAREAELVVDLLTHELATSSDSSIAILVRNRSYLPAIIDRLQQAGIAWSANDIDPLQGRTTVVDLLTLTRALLDISHRNAWLALLRCPWLALDNSDLLHLARYTPEGWIALSESHPSIFQNLLNFREIPQLSDRGRQRLAICVPLFQAAWENRRRRSLRQSIEGLWVALGGAAALQEQSDLEDAKDFFRLLERHDRGGLIDDMTAFEQAMAKLYARPQVDPSIRVQVMTIHKSKGLEFDCVIIPGLERQSRSDDKQLLLWLERIDEYQQRQLLLSPLSATGEETDPVYDYIRSEQKYRAQLEATRLLYVGCTRAAKRLHLIGQTARDTKTGELKTPPANSYLGILWPTLASEAILYESAHNPSPKSEEARAPEYQQVLRALPAGYEVRPPTRPELFPKLPTPPANGPLNRPPANGFRKRYARFVGTVLHRTLAQITREGIGRWDNERCQHQHQTLARQLTTLGVPASQRNEALQTLATALSNILKDPTGRWLLDGQHTDSSCEISWVHQDTDNVIHRLPHTSPFAVRQSILDRTFIDRDGIRWIIDYKTSQPHPDEPLETFAAREAATYAEPLSRYRKLYQARENNRVVTALYFPLVPYFYRVEE